jgi:hypothetical protein
MMKNVGLSALAMGLVSTMATPAQAAEGAAGGFNISLEVPAICDLSLPDLVFLEDEHVVTGEVHEFCNSSNGFQVIASHRPLDASEVVEVDFDGEFATLSQDGLSPIAFRSGARFGPVPFRIDATHLEAGLAVSFSLIAI